MKTEPVMTTAGALASIWALILAICAWAGIEVPTEVQVAVIPAVLAGGWLARYYTTPLAKPRTNDGRKLVPRDIPDPKINRKKVSS